MRPFKTIVILAMLAVAAGAQESLPVIKSNVAEMKRWLDKNFPTSNDYDTSRIFSPLVAYDQSTT